MIPPDDDVVVLEKLNLLREGRLLRAAVLLFGRDPQRFYLQAKVKIRRFRSEPLIVDDREISRNWLTAKVMAVQAILRQSQAYKWASCSSRGRLTFDPALLRQPARFRVEVIAHELLHLKVPNHGRLFRVLLKALVDQEGER